MTGDSDTASESEMAMGAVARKRVFDIASEPSMGHEQKCNRLLEFGCEFLGLENGHIVRTDEEASTHEILVTAGADLVTVGERRQLDETYCQLALDRDEPMTVFRDTPPDERPIEAEGIASYIGTTYVVDGAVAGTLCFADRGTCRATTPKDRAFVDLLSQWVGRLIERQQYEEQLASRRDRVRLFVEELSEYAMFMLDTDGRVDSWNRGAQLLQGYNESEILGEPLETFCTDEAREAGVPDQLLTAARETGRAETEEWCVCKDGSRYRALVTITTLYDNGTIRGFGVIIRDVTEREQRQAEMEREQEFIERALNTLDDIFFVMAPDGEIDRVNQRAIDVTGYSRAELTSMDPSDLFESDETDVLEEVIADVLATGETRVEATLLTADGERRQYEFRARRLLDDNGTVTGIVGIGRDITEQELDEERIEVAQRVLRHNLRNDLNAIRAWAETLDGEAVDEEAVDRIIQVTDRLVNLSEKTRTMVQLESERADRQTVDAGTLLPAVLDRYRRSHPDATIEYDATDADELLISDGERFETALTNTIENALEHNSRSAWIRVVTASTDRAVHVHIHDNGPGIPEAERGVLEAGEETALEHGSGVGLWLIQWCIATMGGEVTFAERDPRGSIVTLTVPLAES